MPFLNLRTVKGMLNDAQKRHLMEKFTELLIETEGGGNPDFRRMIWIQIQEDEPANWQMGERRPTTASVVDFVRQRDSRLFAGEGEVLVTAIEPV